MNRGGASGSRRQPRRPIRTCTEPAATSTRRGRARPSRWSPLAPCSLEPEVLKERVLFRSGLRGLYQLDESPLGPFQEVLRRVEERRAFLWRHPPNHEIRNDLQNRLLHGLLAVLEGNDLVRASEGDHVSEAVALRGLVECHDGFPACSRAESSATTRSRSFSSLRSRTSFNSNRRPAERPSAMRMGSPSPQISKRGWGLCDATRRTHSSSERRSAK